MNVIPRLRKGGSTSMAMQRRQISCSGAQAALLFSNHRLLTGDTSARRVFTGWVPNWWRVCQPTLYVIEYDHHQSWSHIINEMHLWGQEWNNNGIWIKSGYKSSFWLTYRCTGDVQEQSSLWFGAFFHLMGKSCDAHDVFWIAVGIL